ncbi:MAG: hypothetical protein KKA84_15050 [Bacteroidetes bacterium]|nr:hypothetical protein [Bacteroidota bacterium]
MNEMIVNIWMVTYNHENFISNAIEGLFIGQAFLMFSEKNNYAFMTKGKMNSQLASNIGVL